MQRVQLLPGINPTELQKRFAQHGIPLPTEMLELYSLCGGMAKNEVDNQLFALWQIQDVLNKASSYTDGYVPFADGFLSSYTYLYRENSHGSVQIFATIYDNGEQSELIADSLSEALDYLKNEPMRLWLP